MALAVAVLAPASVANVITNYGDDTQQKTYLPEFAGEAVPPAAVIVSESRPLFDPFELQTSAVREGTTSLSTASRPWFPMQVQPSFSL